MLRFLGALFVTLRRGLDWLVLHVTGRDLAQERAQRLEALREAAEAEQRRMEDEARHQEVLEAAEAQTVETKLLREAIERQAAPIPPKPSGPTVAQRREEIRRQSRSHDVEIRSSTWGADDGIQDEVALILDRAG